MKKVSILIFALFIFAAFTGCMDIIVKAPKGKNIKITSVEPKKYDAQKMVFYILWGLVPVTDNSTEDLFTSIPDGSTVAIKTSMSALDWLITLVLSEISITSHTVDISVIDEK